MNSIFRILVRLVDGLWVFDDSKFGIREQPFVFGSDLILEKMVAEVDEELDQGEYFVFLYTVSWF